MKLKSLPKIERPREKLISKGVENLKDEELLALLLRTGKKGKKINRRSQTKGRTPKYPPLRRNYGTGN